jgi:hypothetical protein
MRSKSLLLAVGIISLLAAAGCGTGGSGSLVLPNSTGSYSNASLKGSYVYQIHGFGVLNGNPYREVGVFTADGNGHITGGSDDASGATTGAQVSGAYTVAKDGTGFVSINTATGPLNFAITLASSSKLYLIEADPFANAGGSAELQDASALSSPPAGTFVFRMHQETSAQGAGSASEVGNLVVFGGSGTGAMDENSQVSFDSTSLNWTLGPPNSLGRGTGSFVNTGTSFSTRFIYYIVSATHFVMLVSNGTAVGSGSAELQTGNVGNGLSGNYAFGSRGETRNFFLGVARVGQLIASAGSLSTTQDVAQDGNVASGVSSSACYTAASNGRVVVTSVSGGTCSTDLIQVFWMVSPSRAFFVNNSAITFEDGTADMQTSANFSTSNFNQQYAMAMDGIDVSPELLSRTGTIKFDGSGKITVNEVLNVSNNSSGAQSPGLFSGTYSVASSGRVSMTANGGSLNLVLYAVSPSQAYVLQTDSGTVTSGMLRGQQ